MPGRRASPDARHPEISVRRAAGATMAAIVRKTRMAEV
jgi:hypothetical protein